MKTAKARLEVFVLECPHCDRGLLQEPQSGALNFDINQQVPLTGVCADCGVESKVPSRVPGEKIVKAGG